MSNLETIPQELLCPSNPGSMEVLEPRLVPLGGPRAMTVRRTLPQRRRSLIGAWCFVDHFGPDRVSDSGGMNVPPHPHTGLQTVSWLFTGEVEHRDSAGNHAMVVPGELNLMTAGRGIAHSEISTPATTVLHGAQLWVALPDGDRFTAPSFEHYRPEPVVVGDASVRVFLGSLGGSVSPVRTFTPLLGAELTLDAGGRASFDVDPAFEHGVLLDAGTVEVNGTALAADELGYVGLGHTTLEIVSTSDVPVRALIIGGVPLGESILMWWNFVGRSHEEIAAYRASWQAEIGAEEWPADLGAPPAGPQYGRPVGSEQKALPAPTLPGIRLRPRENPAP
jgi:quercetin 2,3-dioxygenase